MAVALLGTPASTERTTNPANYTVSAGSDRALLVFTHIEGAGDTMDSITYGTQAMTLIDVTAEWSASKIYCWWLDEAGIAAASTTAFSASYTGSPANARKAHYVIALSGASQTATTEFNESVGDTTDPVSAALTGEDGAFGIAMANVTVTTITWTWDNSWTKDMDTTTLTANDASTAYRAFSGSGAQTASANSGDSNSKGLLAVRVSPVSSSSVAAAMYHYRYH